MLHLAKLHQEQQEAKQNLKQRGTTLDEESQALVSDLMLEGCSDVLLTDDSSKPMAASEATPENESPNSKAKSDCEIEIIDEKKGNVTQPTQTRTLLQPLTVVPTVTTTLQPLVMSLVAGTNGQVVKRCDKI